MMCVSVGSCIFCITVFFKASKNSTRTAGRCWATSTNPSDATHHHNSYSKGANPKKQRWTSPCPLHQMVWNPSIPQKNHSWSPSWFPNTAECLGSVGSCFLFEGGGGALVVEKKWSIKHGTEQETAMQILYIFQQFPFRKAVNGS